MPLPLRRLALRVLPGSARVGELSARLVRAQARVEFWKRRFERATASADRMKKMLDDMKERVRDVRTQADVRQHNRLTSAVLAQLLPGRARQRPVLAADVAAAEVREQRFLAGSEEYGKAIADDGARQAHLHRTPVMNVPWWLPRDEARAGRGEKLQQQGFPLRAILQTREVALGGIMLDLGANVGRTSIIRVLLGDVRVVYAAEPDPTNYACLVQNVVEHGLRGVVLPDRVAIGASRGEVQLRRSAHIGGHRVLRDDVIASGDTLTVPRWSVDEWMGKVGAEPEAVSFVKVDTQGSEVNVLRGASALLARRQAAWQMEVDPGLLTRAGATVEELLVLLAAHFTHFIDIGRSLPGQRVRPVQDLGEAVAYVGAQQDKTDLVLYNAASY